jgi:hypothetical protein
MRYPQHPRKCAFDGTVGQFVTAIGFNEHSGQNAVLVSVATMLTNIGRMGRNVRSPDAD